MKIKLNEPIRDFEGNPLQNNGKELTYGILFRNLLGAPMEKDNGDRKLKKFEIGLKCVADQVDLTLDEAKIIKDTVEQAGVNPIIYGRVTELLDNKPKTKDK